MSFIDTFEKYRNFIDDADSIKAKLYEEKFSPYFSDVRSLYSKFKSRLHVVSDEDLQNILLDVPMNLFMASENLNQLRLEYEILKLNISAESKRLKSDIRLKDDVVASLTKSEIKELCNDMIQMNMVEQESLLAVYKSIISQVESEQSFARELIMGAKKVWDSRRSAEMSSPVSPVETGDDLPEYRL